MAFKFKGKPSHPPKNVGQQDIVLPKLSNSQLNKLTKINYPNWLKDSCSGCLKNLPAIYHGVLGQVQMQPPTSFIASNNNKNDIRQQEELFLKQQSSIDYMNRFTDTERVRQLLSTSQLSNDQLATIWAHVNKTFPGKLTNREVCLALALIAVFQQDEQFQEGTNNKQPDPFTLIKSKKKPPVPKLYSSSEQSSKSIRSSPIRAKISNLIDISDGTDDSVCKEAKQSRLNSSSRTVKLSQLVSLIDLDGDKFEANFTKLSIMWLKFLSSMKTVFKRSFDVLNVENSRIGAIEALKSESGQSFCKQLCICYPLAHNIKYKIDELNRGFRSSVRDYKLFDEEYVIQIDDLMISINEYWAVLINLIHESGQTKFIEFIMDGLNYKTKTVSSETINELANELDSSNRSDLCSICHTKFYLIKDYCDHKDALLFDEEDAELLANTNNLLTNDNEYYYHARCANFWLNSVAVQTGDDAGLPISSDKTSDHVLGLLSPDTLNALI